MTDNISEKTLKEALKRAKELAAAAKSTASKRSRDGSSGDEDYPSKRRSGVDFPVPDLPPMGFVDGMNGGMLVDQVEVPDPCVGLVIGKGGENISSIQSMSNCRIQMAPDTLGKTTRTCTLQGSQEAIAIAKEMINDVVERGSVRPPPGQRFGGGGGEMAIHGGGGGGGGTVTEEMIIPGYKCGLVIGKGGETIKNIQERTGVKMILIQESHDPQEDPKPLRFIGDPEKIEFAKSLVEEVLNSKDDMPPSARGGGGGGQYGAFNKQIGEVIVPRGCVGMIIGKGGEMIKRLGMESGAKIQFKMDEDQDGPERTAIIQGNPESINRATQMISELVGRSMNESSEVFYMHIPATKTGLVIGKGGETIKQICAESRAHVELSRDPPPNQAEKIFIIKGSPQQINHAQHIIRIKVGDIPPGTPVPSMGGGPGGMMGPPGGGGGGGPFGGGGGPFSGGYGPPPGGPGPNPWGAPGNENWDYTASETGGYEAGGGGGETPVVNDYWAEWQNFAVGGGGPAGPGGPGGGGDPAAAAAQWAQYYAQYAQYYQQQQMQQPQPPLPPAATPAQPAAPQQPAQAAVATGPGGQPDYSAQWAEYYRSMGMHEQATMIEQQAKLMSSTAQQTMTSAASSAPQPPAPPMPTAAPRPPANFSGAYQYPSKPSY